ncbi:esterase-like activity of phytase family protein [Pseudosulfitobacter koreensis]|uniref:Esterase-like activity of phytase family protein n=1 Tax=Pseudosulfitobacter koreensis TaxID=2968472 RepID=A0ABT1YWS6_9RHOB|nr:esterase-like activity of phytase family protein [Pseudosulfitobacter koreense]MCR8825341.1 esterase-like activity of phytase family protein [Pseudosulfitobacter koreense]
MFWRSALAVVCTAACVQAEPTLTLDGVITLPRLSEGFGGLSAIEMSDGGAEALVLSDRGGLYHLTLDRSGDAVRVINAVRDDRAVHLGDTEGLALDADGTLYVSMEGQAGIAAEQPDGRLVRQPGHPDFKDLVENRALEALAIAPDGTLVTLPEISARNSEPFPIYQLKDGRWTKGPFLPRDGIFLVTGADFGPDGLFYLLERSLSLRGFATRIRRFDLSAPDLEETTLLVTEPGTYGNLEGLSLWQDDLGITHLSLVADDNFYTFFSNQIVEFTLTE